MQISTGLRNAMLDSNSFKGTMDGAFLYVFDGTMPSDADSDQSSATLLATITVDDDGSTGLTFESSASGGVISKTSSETWEGNVDTAGTAIFFRLMFDGDSGGSSSSEPRVQGTIGLAGEDMNLSSVSLVQDATQTVDYFSVALPAE